MDDARREWVWESRLWPDGLGFVAIAIGFGVMFYFVSDVPDPSHQARSHEYRLIAGSVVTTFFLVFFTLLVGFTPRQLVVSDDGVVVRRWLFGRKVIEREAIDGVIPTTRGRGVVFRLKRGPVWSPGSTDDLQPKAPRVGEVALAVFGPTTEQLTWNAAVAAASSHVDRSATVRIDYRRRWFLLVSDGLSVLVLLAGAVWCRSLMEWLLNTSNSLAALSLMLGGVTAAVNLAGTGLVCLAGGTARRLIVGPQGLTVEHQWKTRQYAAGDIQGVSEQVTLAPRTRRSFMVHIHRRVLNIRPEALNIDPVKLASLLRVHLGTFEESRRPVPARTLEP